jgi:hypothetical protein
MKKLSLVLIAAIGLFSTNKADAQLQKGNFMVGAGLANFDFGLQKGASIGIDLHPRVGYFFRDNAVVGALVNFGFNYAKSQGTNINYGINAFGRYYFSDKQVELLKHTRVFGEASLGINGKNTIVTGKPNSATNGLGIGIGPGIAYFLTPNIGLEALAKYNGIVGFGTTATAHSLNIEVGFQIYLTGKKARAIYHEVETEVEKIERKERARKAERDIKKAEKDVEKAAEEETKD